MASVTGTNGNDILFFSGDLGHLTTTLVNDYSGQSVFIDDDFNINNSTYEGLAGIDTLFMTNVGDAFFITDGVGTQTMANIERIIAGDGGDVIVLSHGTITLGDIFIDGGRADDVLWGNVGNDSIRGFDGNDNIDGGPGNDILLGQNDNDIISGGDGNDNIDGGAGVDTASYAGMPGAATVNLLTGVALDGNGGTDTLTGIENVTGTSFNDMIIGNAGANVLNGGAGDDLLVGGVGNDTLIGGSGSDTVDYSAAATGVTVDLSIGAATDGSGGIDTLVSIENATGSAFADNLVGDANGNTLQGGAGNDILTGSAGNDTLDGGADIDMADYSTAAAGVSVDLAAGTANDGLGGTDTLTGIENISGSAFADTLAGDANGNIISGGAGNDMLAGGAGNDVLDGGADIDTADYSAAAAGVTVNLATGTANDGSGGTDTLTGIENISGSAFADMLTGDADANVLSGNAGDDVLNGGDGADDLNGGVGADLLEGGNGNDILRFSADIVYDGGTMAYNAGSPGIAGTEEIKSASGSNGSFDVFNGGAGFDTLVMTNGNDTLFLWDDINPIPAGGSETRVSGIEQIDAGAGNDIVDFTHEDYAYGDVIMNGGEGNDYLWASSGNDTLDGGNDNDNLYGGVGNDMLYGGNGDDVIIGGPNSNSGALVTTTQSHQFSNDVVFPSLTECVSIMDLVPPGDNALGIAAGDLSVSYSTTAEISFVQTVAGYNNSLGFYNISQDGTIGGVTLAFPNVKNYDAGDTATINLPGAPDTDFGFFIISDGASKNNFNTMDLVNGNLDFVYLRNSAHERAATIHDDWNKISLVYTNGSVEKVLKGDIFHTTERGGDTNLNSDGDVHVVSGVINNGDTSSLRIGFEDLKHVGDADYNDVVFDVTVASRQTGTTLVVDDHDILYGGAGNDILDGGVGDDVLFGGEGADTLTGGHGRDQFVFDVMDGFADTVKDFALGATGDVLNITDILQGYDAMSDAISDFVRLVNSGGNTQLQVNEDGDAGGSFAAVAIIEGGVGSATLADLINNGNLVANQPPVM